MLVSYSFSPFERSQWLYRLANINVIWEKKDAEGEIRILREERDREN
tara:strand:- start:119 stop:259 length:141 start_codon:yes stop_codon:yes gene_type:complete